MATPATPPSRVGRGADLVIRTSRGLTLTQPGVALAQRGERIAAELTAAQHDLAVLAGRVSGLVTVVAYATPPRRAPASLHDVLISTIDRPAPRSTEDLAVTRWIVGPPGSTTASVVDHLARTEGWAPTIAHEAVEYSALLALAAAGLGFVLIPRLALRHLAGYLDQELAVTAMPDLSGRQLFARHRSGRREPAPAVSAVIELLVEIATAPYA